MVSQRRAFNKLPPYFQTEQNNREYYVTDDVLFEPEQARFLVGYIGDTSRLTEDDLKRTPAIPEEDLERLKYQLTVGAAYIDPNTGEYLTGAFYTDLINQINANGGVTTDPNRLFSVNFYSWTPPIDYDMHINFSRYVWTGPGTANENGEYITKEPAGSKTYLYEFIGTEFIRQNVTIVNGLPQEGNNNQIIEDVSTTDRLLYKWNGNSWNILTINVSSNIPTNHSEYEIGDYVYVTRTGSEWNRPLVWMYSEQAGRWIPQPVIVSLEEPDTLREGMIWEDARIIPYRQLKRLTGEAWVTISYTPQNGPTGIGTDGEYIYDIRDISSITDKWMANNWWRHAEDLSPVDREQLIINDNATRPIIQFWNGIEPCREDNRINRNQFPEYSLYRYNAEDNEIIRNNNDDCEGSTIYQYVKKLDTQNQNQDSVLEFSPVFNSAGEFEFQTTIATIPIEERVPGYYYFRDQITGYMHSIWAKSDEKTNQSKDSNGFYNIPTNLNSNSDHGILLNPSRSKVITHFSSIIASQDDFSGSEFGLSSYRWSKKNPTRGATLIDAEQTLLRAMATIQNKNIDIPDSIRQISKEYNKFLFKFQNRLNQRFDDLTLSDPTGLLHQGITVTNAVDAILTEIFIGRNETFPFHHSDMGTFVDTEIFNGIASVIDQTPRPIYIPPSGARVGAFPPYKPEKFMDQDGITKIRGHDGTVIKSFDDDRDSVWMELQNRFFNKIPTELKEENERYSSRYNVANFHLQNYFGNYKPLTDIQPVNEVVDDYRSINNPTPEIRVFSKSQAIYAVYDGSKWLIKNALVDDIFLNYNNSKYYIYNGISTYEINYLNREYDFEYSTNEFLQIIRRDFDRWLTENNITQFDNENFNETNPFTWNYRSVGLEGHYQGIYRRLYNSIRPHSHPWEIVGYTIKPNWWIEQYPPSHMAPDGTCRYSNNAPMWKDLQSGIINPISKITKNEKIMTAPIPVNDNGELLDPIALGIVNETELDKQRINDGWIFGDGSPVEQQFIESPLFQFSYALTGFLMKTGEFVDKLWIERYITVGDNGDNLIWRYPHIVHQKTLDRPALGTINTHLSKDQNGNIIKSIGVNSWIAERVKINGGDPYNDFSKIIQNTKPTLGWKTAGFINKTRTNISTLSGNEIPFEDIHTILHRSAPIREEFCSGVTIIPEGSGYRVYGYDQFNPYFRIETPAIPTIGGQVELREKFIAVEDQHEFQLTQFQLPISENSTTSKLAIIFNGLKIRPQFYTIKNKTTIILENTLQVQNGDSIVVSFLTAQSNPSTRVKTFTASNMEFTYFAVGSGQYANIEYGRYFENPTDVINFLIGYGRYLNARGWIFDYKNEADEIVDWITAAKTFANWVVQRQTAIQQNNIDGILIGQQFQFSPISNQAKFNTEFGHITNVESIQNGAYGVVNENVEPIFGTDVFTSRIGPEMTVTSTGREKIYGLRIYVVEYQHAVFFSNITRFNDLIYDPILALRHNTLKVDSYRTEPWNGRLDSNGFIIYNGNIIPNFDKLAKDFTRFYDRRNPVDDPVKRDQARNLYGWYPNDAYMNALATDDRARFDYYRGMIQNKGTIRPIHAFSRGTRIGSNNVFIYEDWGWLINKYGDVEQSIIQFSVGRNDFHEIIQVIQFSNEINENNIINITDFDRNNPNANSRWILPPNITNNGKGNVSFQVTQEEIPNLTNVQYYLKLFEVNTGLTILQHSHFDPELKIYEQIAYTQVDYEKFYDPARYTHGPNAENFNDLSWGKNHVGEIWWDTSTRKYLPYRDALPDYNLAARNWGQLMYFNATIIRNDHIATVTTLNWITKEKIPHNLNNGDKVVIIGADQEDYNQEIIINNVTTNTFDFQVITAPNTPATGNIQVYTGFIDLYEWVESPVKPDQWEEYIAELETPGSPTGTTLNNASYTEIITFNTTIGRNITTYYFWVKNNQGFNPKKQFPTKTIAQRLESPTKLGVPWFAPVNKNTLIMYANGEKIENGYGVELIIDKRNAETHYEWTMISQNDQFNKIPDNPVDKLIDSMAGISKLGDIVPDPMLTQNEKYGTQFIPVQTLFQNKDDAIITYINKVNNILANKDLTNENPTIIFQLNDEHTNENTKGFWKRVTYINKDYQNITVYDTVTSEEIRNDKAEKNLYANNDLIRVTQSNNTDIWNKNQQVATIYVYKENMFIEVGVENHTLMINENISNNPEIFREIYYEVNNYLSIKEYNELFFTMMHEMLRQHPNCDWFIKTSYISAHIFDNISQSPFVRPNEITAIINNINDTKPFRTKLRTETAVYTIQDNENFLTQIQEFPNQKYTMMLNRLAQNLEDEGEWDAAPWDSNEEGWDTQIHNYENLGTNERRLIGNFIGDGLTTEFIAYPNYDAILYQTIIEVLQNNEPINPTDIMLEITVLKKNQSITIKTNYPLTKTFQINVYQTIGFYEGNIPTLGNNLINTSFQPTPSTYEHHTNLNQNMPQDTEERIIQNVMDNVTITVKNYWTEIYDGWDTTPHDTIKWNQGTENIGPRTFIMLIGAEQKIEPNRTILQTSDTISPNPENIVIGPEPNFNIEQVYRIPNGTNIPELQNEGIQYDLVTPFKHIIKFRTPEPETFIANGVITSFTATNALNGIEYVTIDNARTTNYIIDYERDDTGKTITFNQPPQQIIDIKGNFIGRSFIGNGITNVFNIGTPTNSLNENNVFVFINGEIQYLNEYTVNDEGLQIENIPENNSNIITLTEINNVNLNDPVFSIRDFVGDGNETTYVVGNNANNLNCFVFVGRKYQVLNEDYRHPVNGTIEFINIPDMNENIHIRTVLPNARFIGEHYTLISTGENSQPVPGLFDVIAENTLVFVNNEIKNGFTNQTPDFIFTKGNPVRIKWIGIPPQIGTTITIRTIESVVVSETIITNTIPFIGSEIKIVPRKFLEENDNITFIYNGWPVGKLGTFNVISTPGDFEIINEILTLNNIPSENQSIVVEYLTERLGGIMPKSILVQMTNIVDDILEDHQIYDINGFEENRPVNLRVINSTNAILYIWNGSTWIRNDPIQPNTRILVIRKQAIFEYNRRRFTKIYEVGEEFTTPPVLNYPLFGKGIISGTYALGQATNAEINFPEAYQINQHPPM